ncbi:MAG: hypothetical protein JNK04_15885, partial [Myxococcales bacterium]|nr:hypothetical protein [Myxococcales bacterium]
TGQGTALAVGSGGHALAIDTRGASPVVVLEAVETVQDLVGVCLDEENNAWAWSANGRLLRRDRGAVWRRIPAPGYEAVVGGFCFAGSMCLVSADGSILRVPVAGW